MIEAHADRIEINQDMFANRIVQKNQEQQDLLPVDEQMSNLAQAVLINENSLFQLSQEKTRVIFQELYTIFLPDQNMGGCSSRKVVAIALKISASALCYVATVPFIEPAEKVVDDPILKKFFAVGEIIAWGTLSAWSACNIINRISRQPQNCEKISNIFKNIGKYWIPLAIVGIASEAPSAYVTYHYNHNIFWSVFTPVVYSAFVINSLDALIQKIVHSNNYLTRYLYKHTYKSVVFDAKANFSTLLESCLSAFLKNPQFEPKRELIDLVFSTDDKEGKFRKVILKILQISLEIKIKQIEKEPIFVKIGNTTVQVLGSLASLVTSGVEAYLVYKGCKLFVDNDYLIALMVIFAITPSIYLSVDINRCTYSNAFLSLTNLPSNFKLNRTVINKLPNGIGYCIALLITFFGLGTLTTVMQDTFGFDRWWFVLLSVVVILSSGLLATNSMCDFSDQSIESLRRLRLSNIEKDSAEFNDRLQNLIEHFKVMPAGVFSEFISSLKVPELNIKSLSNRMLKDSNMRELFIKISETLHQENSQLDLLTI